ncbi:hypothetical protein Tco_0327903 [Tanacetum coccineum]
MKIPHRSLRSQRLISDHIFVGQLGITKESTLAGTRETSRCSYYKQSKLNWLAARYEEFGETGIGSTLQCYGKN